MMNALPSYAFVVAGTGLTLAYHDLGRGGDLFFGSVLGALLAGGLLVLVEARRSGDATSGAPLREKDFKTSKSSSRSSSPCGVAESPASLTPVESPQNGAWKKNTALYQLFHSEKVHAGEDTENLTDAPGASLVSKHASLKWGDDELAEGYADMTEHWPQHEHIYRYTMFKLLGSLQGKIVLDVPCGEGRFTERILKDGAAGVLCCDIAPKMCQLTEARLRRCGLVSRPVLLSNPSRSPDSLGVVDRFRAVVGDMTRPLALPGPLCDAVCASFLFEYSATIEQLHQTAQNLFAAAAPGAPLCVIYVPGAKAKEDIKVVKEVMGIQATELTPDLKPGAPVVVQYFPELQPDKARHAKPFSYTIHFWPVEHVAAALTLAGFVDVHVQRLQLNPEYKNTRGFDLERFVKHTGNRCLIGRKP